MKIAVLCSSRKHPVYPLLESWCRQLSAAHTTQLVEQVKDLPAHGDLLFLVSCSELITSPVRDRFKHVLVLHASDLPRGRGWSPHVWEVLGGADRLTVSLLEAEDKVDSGRIWAKQVVPLDGTELYDEINAKLFAAEIALMTHAVEYVDRVIPIPQDMAQQMTYYPRRSPADSELDPHRSLAEQFDLLRVCDPERYPAFFRLRGATYKVVLEKIDHE